MNSLKLLFLSDNFFVNHIRVVPLQFQSKKLPEKPFERKLNLCIPVRIINNNYDIPKILIKST